MQVKPDFLDQLIDKASAKAGNDNKLAAELGVNRANISQWRKGSKPCPASDIALMAELAGMDPEAWAARAIVAQYEGTPKGEKLARVLGKAVLATGAVIASAGAHAAGAFDLLNTMYKRLSYFTPKVTMGGYPPYPRPYSP